MPRDLTQDQFLRALKRHNIGAPEAPFGYCRAIKDDNRSALVHPINGGWTRREQLSYLIRRQKEEQRRLLGAVA